MTALYYRPPDGTIARSVALAQWASGLLVPQWDEPRAWFFNGSGLVLSPVSGTSGYGYADAGSDASSGAWLVSYASGSVDNLASGTAQTLYALPVGRIFTGLAYSPGQAKVYVVDVSGTLYTPSGTGAVQLASGLGRGPPWSLSASGNTLLTLLAAASGVGTFTLTASAAGSSGLLAAPMTTPACLVAASGRVGVGGWSNAALASGYTDLSLDPAVATLMLGTVPGSNSIAVLSNAGNETWSVATTATGLGAPSHVAWLPSGLGAFVTDPTSGQASLYNYSAGVLSFSQSFAASGAGDVAVMPGSVLALVLKPALNQVLPISFSGSWATGAVVALTHPNAVVALTASGAAVAYASGVAFLTASGSVWSVASSASLPYAPNSITADASGNVYTAGNQGVSGSASVLVSQAVSATFSWAGSGSGVVYRQGQIVVGDPSVGLLRTFGLIGGVYASGGAIGAPGAYNGNLLVATRTLFAGGSGSTSEYQFTAPFTLDYLRNGMASVLVSGAFNTATLGPNHQPAALAFDASGNLSVATVQNDLYTISATGGIAASGSVVQASPQPQTTPIGLSWMLWQNGHLYAASSLEGTLVQVV